MPYTTQTDLELAAGGADRLVELADWNRDRVADPGVLTEAQAAAAAFIDSHLRRFNAGDLERLRATPSDTIKRLAAAEAIFWIREKRGALTSEEIDLRKQRIEELKDIRADKLRADDQKAPRAMFIDNDGEVSRDGMKGLW